MHATVPACILVFVLSGKVRAAAVPAEGEAKGRRAAWRLGGPVRVTRRLGAALIPGKATRISGRPSALSVDAAGDEGQNWLESISRAAGHVAQVCQGPRRALPCGVLAGPSERDAPRVMRICSGDSRGRPEEC
jgi:hypothetical protein